MDRRTPLFLTAIGISSFLLFALELYAGRVVLPVFGGSPAVWTTALCFFTGTVFLGYVYAHLVATRLSHRTAAIVHVTLAIAALVAAVLAPSDLTTLRFADMPPTLNVLVVLAAIVGAPAFLLSTTTPLLSARFARDGNDPWWLYAVSNSASLAGLLAYPFVIEPSLPLSMQRVLAEVLIAVLAVTLGAVLFGGPGARPVPGRLGSDEESPSRRRQAIWVFAASVPAGLLSAVTTHLATDHVSSPVLWIGPLGVYLAGFIIAFSARGRRILPAVDRLVPAAATLLWIPFFARIAWPIPLLMPLLLGCYAVLAIAIHGRIALDRPSEVHLTRFYVLLSAGGLLATAFVALVAPLVFSDVYEYPLFIVAALLALALFDRSAASRISVDRMITLKRAAGRLAPLLFAGAVLVLPIAQDPPPVVGFVGVLLFTGTLVVALGVSPRSLAAGTAVALAVLLLAFAPEPVVRVRTFFGITEVRATPDGEALAEIHGTTLHGIQYADARRSEPTAYFVRSGPLGDIMDEAHRRQPQHADVGVVGLGVGTVAAYARPADAMVFFEIDRAIVDLARDPRYFTYLADAPIEPGIVLGDGRLSLAGQAPESFDLLVLDAFSSDSVPTHLLTREAMRTYRRTLRPGGLMAFQLTNRHFDLVGAVSSTARSLGMEARVRSYVPAESEVLALAAQPSTWVIVGDPDDVAAFDAAGWTRPEEGPVLTDDYPDVMRLLRLRPVRTPSPPME